MRLYEGMFLIEAGRAARDWEATEAELLAILEKHGVQMKQKTRYDERKLAYPVKGYRRGAYLLTYFEAEPPVITEINGDLNLSEVVLRSMILNVDGGAIPEAGPLGNMEPMKPGEQPRRVAEEEARAAAERASLGESPAKPGPERKPKPEPEKKPKPEREKKPEAGREKKPEAGAKPAEPEAKPAVEAKPAEPEAKPAAEAKPAEPEAKPAAEATPEAGAGEKPAEPEAKKDGEES